MLGFLLFPLKSKETTSITTGTTISFFLMYCTPRPFPFVTCTTGISATQSLFNVQGLIE
jgi:hypothetical protein